MPISAKVRRVGNAGFIACLATMALAVTPAQAVVCPDGEPDFVYNDIGSDGCFDVGVDAQIPDASLFAGTYYAPVGGIVVPHGVTVAPPMGTDLSWNADTFFVRGRIEATGTFAMSGNAIEVEAKAEVLGISVGFNMNNDVIVGDGAKLTATTGLLSISQGGTCTVGVGARLTGFSVSFFSNFLMVIGEGSDIEATGGNVSLNGNLDIELHSGIAVVALSGISIANSGSRTIGDGVKLTAGGSATLGGSAATSIGDGVKVNANGIYISGTNIVAGDKLSLLSAGYVVVQGTAVQIGDKTKMFSATTTYITSSAGSVSLGIAKLTAGDDIAFSGADQVVIQTKSKLTTQGDLALFSLNGIQVGANTSLSAGEDIDLESSSPSLGGIVTDGSVKLTSGTLKNPMAPSMIKLHGFSVFLALKNSLRGADLNNTILLDPLSVLQVSGAKVAGKTITLGDDANAPFPTFVFTDVKAKGSADGATFTIHAPGTACHLDGSTFKSLTLDSSSCATVTGP